MSIFTSQSDRRSPIDAVRDLRVRDVVFLLALGLALEAALWTLVYRAGLAAGVAGCQ